MPPPPPTQTNCDGDKVVEVRIRASPFKGCFLEVLTHIWGGSNDMDLDVVYDGNYRHNFFLPHESITIHTVFKLIFLHRPSIYVTLNIKYNVKNGNSYFIILSQLHLVLFSSCTIFCFKNPAKHVYPTICPPCPPLKLKQGVTTLQLLFKQIFNLDHN